MSRRSIPLNGSNTHPLTPAALGMLERIAREPVPVQAVNPGLNDRFSRGGLTETVDLASPYASHKGRAIPHHMLSQAGRDALHEARERLRAALTNRRTPRS